MRLPIWTIRISGRKKMQYFELLLLGLLVISGISTCLTKNLLASLVIFMAYSLIMTILWALLRAPDLAVTEAAVGAGISRILLFITLHILRRLRKAGKRQLHARFHAQRNVRPDDDRLFHDR